MSQTDFCQVLILLALLCTAHICRAQMIPVDARIASITGTVLLSNGLDPPTAAKRGDVLIPGEEIDTRGGGRVTIELTDGSLIVVRPYSRIVLKDFRAASSIRELFDILLGQVRVRINHFGGKPNPYRINSPTASIAVRGTEFNVAVSGGGDTEVVVYEGLVEVTNLSDPANKVLLHPGQGVIVRPNQDIHIFAYTPGQEFGWLRENQETGGNNEEAGGSNIGSDVQQSENAISPRSSAGIYDHFINDLIAARHGPFYQRFTAYPDSFLDSLENPAYATEFTAPAGRFFLVPALRGAQNANGAQSTVFSNPGASVDYALSPQGSFFTPLHDQRTSIGGGVAAFRSGSQSFIVDDNASLSRSVFPTDATGTRASSNTRGDTFYFGSFVVAHAFGQGKKTSLGFGVDHVKGVGSLLNFMSQQDAAGNVLSERVDSRSHLAETRTKVGLTHDFSGERKIGIFYDYGFISSTFHDISHTSNGQPQTLDMTQSAGRFSEAGIRFRGVLTRKLFYGLQASWFLLSSNEQWKLSSFVNSHEQDRTTGSSFSAGLGYVFNPRLVFTLDLAGGFSNTTGLRIEDATGNALERNRRATPFYSAHAALQADIWKNMFVTGSLLTVRQNLYNNLTLNPDQFGRLLTTSGTFVPNGYTSDASMAYYSEFGMGWRFNNNFLAEYVFFTDYGRTSPSHILLLRYTFHRHEH